MCYQKRQSERLRGVGSHRSKYGLGLLYSIKVLSSYFTCSVTCGDKQSLSHYLLLLIPASASLFQSIQFEASRKLCNGLAGEFEKYITQASVECDVSFIVAWDWPFPDTGLWRGFSSHGYNFQRHPTSGSGPLTVGWFVSLSYEEQALIQLKLPVMSGNYIVWGIHARQPGTGRTYRLIGEIISRG